VGRVPGLDDNGPGKSGGDASSPRPSRLLLEHLLLGDAHDASIIGGLMLLYVWFNHDPPKEPWKSDILLLLIWAMLTGFFFYYQNQRVIQKLQRKIGWLEQMLKNVHREAESMRKASIDESLQLRVDILGDEGGPHARVKDRNQGKTLGEIL
jgi:hypothetical protein